MSQVSGYVNTDKYYLTFRGKYPVPNPAGDSNNIKYDVSSFFQRIRNPKQKFRIKLLAFSFGDSVVAEIPTCLSIEIPEFNPTAFVFDRNGQYTDNSIQYLPLHITGNQYPYVADTDDGGVVGYLSQLQTMTIRLVDAFDGYAPTLPHFYVLRLMVKPIPDETTH